MQNSLKKSYKFAIKTAVFITILATLFMALFLHYFHVLDSEFVIFPIACYIICFLVIQYRVERFIYRRVKRIYDDLTLLESTDLRQQPITTDMSTLTKEIDRYAKGKKIEIETLKVREEYRKEFLGNVSHELKTPLFTVQGYIETLLDGAIDDKKFEKNILVVQVKVLNV